MAQWTLWRKWQPKQNFWEFSVDGTVQQNKFSFSKCVWSAYCHSRLGKKCVFSTNQIFSTSISLASSCCRIASENVLRALIAAALSSWCVGILHGKCIGCGVWVSIWWAENWVWYRITCWTTSMFASVTETRCQSLPARSSLTFPVPETFSSGTYNGALIQEYCGAGDEILRQGLSAVLMNKPFLHGNLLSLCSTKTMEIWWASP